MQEITKRKLLRAICHGSALTSWAVVVIGMPIVAMIISNDPLVRSSGKEAVNFILSIIIAALAGIGSIIGCGFFLAMFAGNEVAIPIAIGVSFFFIAILAIYSFVLPLIAVVTVCADPDRPFSYPLTLRLIRSTELAA